MRRLIGENVISSNVSYESFRYNSNTTIADLKDKIDSADYVIVISEIGSAAQMEQTHWLTRVPTEVVNYANEVNKDAVVLSISKPYDVANYPNAKAVAAVYGNKGMDPTEGLTPDSAFGPNIPAGIEVIFGGHAATGKLPVDVNKFENGSFSDEVVYPIGYGLTYDAVDIADKTALKALIEEMDKVENQNYTDDSWNLFKQALNDAKNVVANKKASQEEVDSALVDLNNAYNNLTVKKVDNSKLEELVDQMSKVEKGNYTDKSWNNFTLALENAKKVLNDKNATQKDIDAAIEALNKAYSALEKTSTTAPSTGDETKLYGTIAALGLTGLALLAIRKKEK